MPLRTQQCPPDFQERIARAGGLNKYGEPNYKLVWGEAHVTRAGGYWEQQGFTGYRDVHLNDTPCWLLLEWHDPVEYGTPTLWYMDGYDEATGLQTLGEFPYRGTYQVLFILRDTRLEAGQLVVDAMPLNSMLIDVVMPLMMLGKTISHERRARAIKERRAIEEEEQLRIITDARMDAQLAFGGASFRGRFGASSDIIAKKEEALRKGMVQAYRMMKHLGMGISVR